MIKQPYNSKLCGQCCLATILNISLDEAIKLIGHKRGTYSWELTNYFKHEKMKRGEPKSYSLCRVHFLNTWKTHWVLYIDGNIYEPEYGGLISYSEWKEFGKCRITSYIKIQQQ